MRIYKIAKLALGILFLISVMGCKETIFSKLEEREASEMIAVLFGSGVEATRIQDKDGAYSVQVNSTLVPQAITLLLERGLPREKFDSLGDIFGAGNILGTPFEQQARFVHAMNQELSNTISSISGVRSARVMLAIPQPKRFEKTAREANASVTVEYEEFAASEELIGKIKLIVANSTPDLHYESVVVVMFPYGGASRQAVALSPENEQTTASVVSADILGIKNIQDFVDRQVALFILLSLLTGTLVWVCGAKFISRRARRSPPVVRVRNDPTGRNS
ncbi:hypothetical protein FEE96_22925 [Parasedimentitalea maritima]|uniref:Flagellar M-ring N-terminal domain-containing protein n=1 Tax=Parasedimentitalea maritima TaxID=2578117 RepID=A0ABY2UNE6_9RHOB|nr:hypothetical protein [Zongyanglinia marina]TLP55330.1 hypothetical protein FEE96_22925 [Zongyanglinia marina]